MVCWHLTSAYVVSRCNPLHLISTALLNVFLFPTDCAPTNNHVRSLPDKLLAWLQYGVQSKARLLLKTDDDVMLNIPGYALGHERMARIDLSDTLCLLFRVLACYP